MARALNLPTVTIGICSAVTSVLDPNLVKHNVYLRVMVGNLQPHLQMERTTALSFSFNIQLAWALTFANSHSKLVILPLSCLFQDVVALRPTHWPGTVRTSWANALALAINVSSLKRVLSDFSFKLQCNSLLYKHSLADSPSVVSRTKAVVRNTPGALLSITHNDFGGDYVLRNLALIAVPCWFSAAIL